jgi:5'-nucleotidase
MRILVDVDGVVADIHSIWLKMYNVDYNDSMTVHDIIKWEMHELVKPECGTKIYDYLKQPEFYLPIPVIKDALWGVWKLREDHEVIFVTSGFFSQKVEWLSGNGFLSGECALSSEKWRTAKDVVITSDKSLIRGDCLIDDYPENLRNFTGAKLLFDSPWNRSISEFPRVMDWDDVIKTIKGI